MNFLISVLILSFVPALVFGQSAPTKPVTTTAAPASKAPKSAEQRLLEVERRLRELDEWYNEYYLQSKNRVSPFLGEKISFGGFFETAITHIGGPDMETQSSINSQLLGINLAAEFEDNTRFVTQIINGLSYTLSNANNNPGLTPAKRQFGAFAFGTLVAQAYLELRKSELVVLQMGLGYVPYGISQQQREPVLFRRRSGPQLASTSDGTSIGIAFPLWMGLHLSGSSSMEKGRTGYNLYTFTPTMNSKTIGGGSRLWWSDSQSLTLGLSLQTADQGTRGYWNSYGADIKYEAEKGGLVAEYAKSKSSGEKDIESYYVEPYWTLKDGEWVIYVAADYINNPNRVVTSVADPYEIWRYGAGVNWLPIPNVRLRAGLLKNDYLNSTDTIAGQERDYYAIDLSAGVAF